MTVKRTELEILDMAISLAEAKESLRNALRRVENSSMCKKCSGEEPKLKKDDIEGLRRVYENRLDNQREELRAECSREVEKTELLERVLAKQKAIELLRWLYKDEVEYDDEEKDNSKRD